MLTFILSKSRIQRIAWKILIEKADGFVQYCSNKERTQFYGRNGELPIRDSLHLSPLAKILQKIAEKQNKVGIIQMQLKSHQVEILFIINMMFFNSLVWILQMRPELCWKNSRIQLCLINCQNKNKDSKNIYLRRVLKPKVCTINTDSGIDNVYLISRSAHQAPNFTNPEFQFPQFKVLQSVFIFCV